MNQSNTLHAVRIDTHRVTLMPEACADEGGVPHDPPLAKPGRVYRDDPPGSFWAAAAASVAIVALCCAVALVGFTLALPKPKGELPRATAKVTT
jgi:hypothetical protein